MAKESDEDQKTPRHERDYRQYEATRATGMESLSLVLMRTPKYHPGSSLRSKFAGQAFWPQSLHRKILRFWYAEATLAMRALMFRVSLGIVAASDGLVGHRYSAQLSSPHISIGVSADCITRSKPSLFALPN